MTQIKKPARRIFTAPVCYRAGVPQITRRFLFADTPFGAIPASNLSWIDALEAIANDSTSSKLLFSCRENRVNAAAVRAGTLNAVSMPPITPADFKFFFCKKTPAFL